MKHINNMIGIFLGLLMPFRVLELTMIAGTSVLALIFFFSSATAAPIILQRSLHFCDRRSVNDAGLMPGKVLTFGVDFTPDGDLTDALGDGPPDGFADSDDVSPPSTAVASQPGVAVPPQNLLYFPLPESPNHFVRSIFFDCDILTDLSLRDSWKLEITNGPDTCAGGSCTLNGNIVTEPVTPQVFGVKHLPFVASFSFEVGDDPTRPLFKWTFPPESTHNRVFIWIQDREDLIGRAARVIHSEPLAATATSFQPDPGVLEGDGHRYTVSIQLDQLRPLPLSNPLFQRLQSRSRAFFSFETKASPVAGPVFLPSVDPTGSPTGGPVYTFNVDPYQPGQLMYIDPPIAVGYDYQIGNGNPNFNSVILPPAGDNSFDLYTWNGSNYVFHATVQSGVEFPFRSGGVDRFRVLGIELGAGLDPNDATAFVTGLTLVSGGRFTGTMTPIIASDVITTEIKLGDGPNCVNPKNKGVVPFAILGGEFDVTTINQATLQVDDDINAGTGGVAPAKLSINDINGDGINDLVIHFNTQDLNKAGLLTDGRTIYITAKLLNGTLLVGSDVIFLSSGPTCQ
jgi:hypothetical protein